MYFSTQRQNLDQRLFKIHFHFVSLSHKSEFAKEISTFHRPCCGHRWALLLSRCSEGNRLPPFSTVDLWQHYHSPATCLERGHSRKAFSHFHLLKEQQHTFRITMPINMRLFMYLRFQSKITKWCVQVIPTILRFLWQRRFASALRSFWPLSNGPSPRETICRVSYLCLQVHLGLHKATFLSLFCFNTSNLEDVHMCETFPSFCQTSITISSEGRLLEGILLPRMEWHYSMGNFDASLIHT